MTRIPEMMTRWAILVLMAAAVLLNGCASSLEGAPCPCVSGYCCWDDVCRPERECHVNIAFVPKASDNPVFRVAFEGARQAASKLTSAGGPSVTVNCWSPPHLSSAEQGAAVVQAIESRPNGLIVSCLEPNVISPAIDDAVARGIPVITYDSDCPHSKRLGFYGMNNYESGRVAADRLVKAIDPAEDGEQKTVAIITGGSAENLTQRLAGFTARLAELNKWPNRHNAEVITILSCNETAEECGGVIDALAHEHPELDGLFITGLWGLQAACSCDPDTGLSCTCDDGQMSNWKNAAGHGKLKTVSYDSLPFELTLMQSGYLSALISQEYFNWGYETVMLMFEHLTQGRPVEDFVDSGFKVYPTDPGPTLFEWQAGEFGPELKCTAP